MIRLAENKRALANSLRRTAAGLSLHEDRLSFMSEAARLDAEASVLEERAKSSADASSRSLDNRLDPLG